MVRWLISCLLILSVVITTGCTDVGLSSSSSTPTNTATSTATTAANSPTPKSTTPVADDALAKLPQLNGDATVEMKLKGGIVTIAVDGKNAPITAGNFVDLVKRGVYTNLTFHRVVKEPTPFVAQGGDPLGNGTGSFIDPTTNRARYIPLEILPEGEKTPVYSKILSSDKLPKLRHTKGAVAMARSQSPDSASSQFYITLTDVNFLDGSYAVFGYVTSGMELVEQIQVGDRIESMTVTKGIENLKVPT